MCTSVPPRLFCQSEFLQEFLELRFGSQWLQFVVTLDEGWVFQSPVDAFPQVLYSFLVVPHRGMSLSQQKQRPRIVAH